MPGEIKRITKVDPSDIEFWEPYELPAFSTSFVKCYEFIRKIPGGWIILSFIDVAHTFKNYTDRIIYSSEINWDYRCASVFIPDPGHDIDWRHKGLGTQTGPSLKKGE